MTRFLATPPNWSGVDSDEMALWFEQVQSATNENALFGGTDGLILDEQTGEIMQQEELYGYLRRYLFVRFASDPNGVNQIPDTANFI